MKFASSSKRHNFPILTQSSFLAARNSHPPKICKSTPCSRFTKRHFVRDKNTQKLEYTYKIQLVFLSLNMDSLFK